jgi:hypothetical protein
MTHIFLIYAIFLSTVFFCFYLLNFGPLILFRDSCSLLGVDAANGPGNSASETHKPETSISQSTRPLLRLVTVMGCSPRRFP